MLFSRLMHTADMHIHDHDHTSNTVSIQFACVALQRLGVYSDGLQKRSIITKQDAGFQRLAQDFTESRSGLFADDFRTIEESKACPLSLLSVRICSGSYLSAKEHREFRKTSSSIWQMSEVSWSYATSYISYMPPFPHQLPSPYVYARVP